MILEEIYKYDPSEFDAEGTNIKIGKLFSDNINEWAVDFHSNHPSFFC
jgi:hypothetical protein